MSALELLADEIDGRLHVAVVKKGVLDNLYIDPVDITGSWASLYLGRVTKVDPRLDAAFVDLGNGLTGFLPAKHVHLPGAGRSEKRTGIAELLKPGQTLMVQVKAEARRESVHENHKLPRLTTKLYCFGQFLIYSPTLGEVMISSRVEKPALIKLASRLKGKGGWIVHPNALRAVEDEIHFESQSLLDEWQAILTAREEGGDKPRLLRAGPHAIARALCDYGTHAFAHVHAGDKKILDRIIAWCEKRYPAIAKTKRLKMFRPAKSSDKLFEMHDVYSALAALDTAQVPLKSGGSLIVEQTQAFAVIDVNQGDGGSPVAVNMEAAEEAMRQMRLRNLSGAILVDFINMAQKSEKARLVEALEKACETDFASAQVHGFTRLGIIELTRKRRSATRAEKIKH